MKPLHSDAIKYHCGYQKEEVRHKESKDDIKVKNKGKGREKQISSAFTTTLLLLIGYLDFRITLFFLIFFILNFTLIYNVVLINIS